jgi:hypothetical protein
MTYHSQNVYRHYTYRSYPAPLPSAPAFFRTRKIGGLRFIWCGRLVMSFCIKRRA